MKKIAHLLQLAILVFLGACTGPAGPPGLDGIDGVDGLDGESFLGTVIEIEGDFTATNNYSLYYEFPNTIKVYDSDVVLIYILWEVDNNLDVWRLLPQTVILDEGILQYNYDFTKVDVQVFLQGTIDFNTLLPAEALDQVFRIVILPASYAQNASVDILDMNSLMLKMGVNQKKIERFDIGEINLDISQELEK